MKLAVAAASCCCGPLLFLFCVCPLSCLATSANKSGAHENTAHLRATVADRIIVSSKSETIYYDFFLASFRPIFASLPLTDLQGESSRNKSTHTALSTCTDLISHRLTFLFFSSFRAYNSVSGVVIIHVLIYLPRLYFSSCFYFLYTAPNPDRCKARTALDSGT